MREFTHESCVWNVFKKKKKNKPQNGNPTDRTLYNNTQREIKYWIFNVVIFFTLLLDKTGLDNWIEEFFFSWMTPLHSQTSNKKIFFSFLSEPNYIWRNYHSKKNSQKKQFDNSEYEMRSKYLMDFPKKMYLKTLKYSAFRRFYQIFILSYLIHIFSLHKLCIVFFESTCKVHRFFSSSKWKRWSQKKS